MQTEDFMEEGGEEGDCQVNVPPKKCTRVRVEPQVDQERKSTLLLLGFLRKLSDYEKADI